MDDMFKRRLCSLSTGRVIDDCEIDTTADNKLHRDMGQVDDIRVELTLNNAVKVFRKERPRRRGDLLATTTVAGRHGTQLRRHRAEARV